MRGELRAWRQEAAGDSQRTQRAGEGSTADWEQGRERRRVEYDM